ncbi:MAG: MFS transporter [bacterium]|nr:MFS transporter [bacterium]
MTETNNRWKAFLPISLVSIITTLDSSVVNVSLPIISKQLGAEIGVVEWVILAYLLAVTSLLMICGRLGDMHGRRSIYQAGILLFTAASALCGFSTSVAMLIAARGLQGIGAALIIGNGPALIGEIFAPHERGKALGMLGTTVAVGLSLGPAVGGFITGWLGWRYIFFLNLPLGVLTAWLVKRNLRPDTVFNRAKFDFAGGATMAASLFCLLLVFSRGADWGWQNPGVLALIAGTILFGWLFFRIEKKAHNPVLDLTLFSNPTFRSATAAGFLAFAALFTQTFLLPFYLINLRGFAPAYAGLFLMAVPSVMMVASPVAGTLSDKIGTRGICALGLLIMGISQFFLAGLGLATSQAQIVSILLLLGLGSGIFNPPNNSELLSSVPKDRLGNAAGMMGLTRSLGMVAGIGISSAIFTGVRTHLLKEANLTVDLHNHSGDFAFLAGLRWAFLAAVVFAWAGMVMVWGRKKKVVSR